MCVKQVLPIWEGTTNVLSLDVLRAIEKSNGGVLASFNKEVSQRLARIKLTPVDELHDSVSRVYQALERTVMFARQHTDKLEIAARDFAFSLSRIYMGNSNVHCAFRSICHYVLSRTLLSLGSVVSGLQNSSTEVTYDPFVSASVI